MATPLHQITFPFTRTSRNGQLITFVRYVADDRQPWHTDKGRRYSQNGSFLGTLSPGDLDVDPFPDVEVPEGFEPLAPAGNPPVPSGDPHLDALAANRPCPPSPFAEAPSHPGPARFPFQVRNRAGGYTTIIGYTHGYGYLWQSIERDSFTREGRYVAGRESQRDLVGPLPEPPPEEVESHPRSSSPPPIDPPTPKEPFKMPTIRQFIPYYLLGLVIVHLILFGLATVAWHTMVSWRVLYGLHDSLWPSTDAWVIHPPVPVEKR